MNQDRYEKITLD